eukprot:Phypoly_transcript_08397.p1 GENE.Phypoly_transcript_08397~~Phypoly_transcript_08397.p1  ORF type:complete len:339 (+),score=71.82 Phypoly_transcript_08397:147-1163(+)
MANKEVLFVARPKNEITPDTFNIVDKEIPKLSQEGEILLKILYLSVDPYMRPKMTEEKSYTPMYELNKPLFGAGIAQVIESKNPNFKEKQIVKGFLRWNNIDKYTAEEITARSIYVLNVELEPSDYLHVAGLTGLTAHIGYLGVGKPKEGDVVLVSGAAGATGSIVGAIAKLKGASKVIGIVGSDEKAALLKKEFGFDETINYKTENVQKRIEEVAPNGVNIYFDNVGGSILDAVLVNMATFGKVITCGAISGYNSKEPIYNYFCVISKRLTIQGFIMGDHRDQWESALKDLVQWTKEGKIKNKKTIFEGLENIVPALTSLFTGGNIGKAIVHVADPN